MQQTQKLAMRTAGTIQAANVDSAGRTSSTTCQSTTGATAEWTPFPASSSRQRRDAHAA